MTDAIIVGRPVRIV